MGLKYKKGDLVRIINCEGFNKSFVKEEDIAKIIGVIKEKLGFCTLDYYILSSKNWKDTQWADDDNVELYIPRKNKLKEKVVKLEENQKVLNNQINEYKDKIKKLEEELTKKNVKKITLKQFFESDDRLGIHCKTEEQAKELLDAFNKMNKTWHSGDSYIEDNNWEIYRENTSSFHDGTFGANKRKPESCFSEFEEIDFTIPLEYLCNEEEKIILKNLDKEYQIIYRDKQGNIIIQKDCDFDKYNFELLNMFTDLFKSLELDKKYYISDLIKE